MNVIDPLKNCSVDEIKTYCTNNAISASICMINIEGDFNFGTLVRNANFFGFENCYHVASSKKWDKRSSVGTYNYTNISHFNSEVSFIERYRDTHTLIGVENNIPQYSFKTVNLFELNSIIANPIFIFGSENNGLSNFILDSCDQIVTIQNYGSVRSLNVGTTSGIIMAYYRNLVETLV